MTIPRIVLQPTCENFFDTKQIAEKLLQLAMRTGYSCVQKNGQRYYGPPPTWNGPPPEKGTEIFIGHIPRDCFEDELVPVFEKIGVIYMFRLMMNFTGHNRGYAFLTYSNPEEAWKAVMLLNQYEIRAGFKITVCKSIDNSRLYVGRIPVDKTKEEVWVEASHIMPQIKYIIMYPDITDRSKNRGFFFAEFASHREAAITKKDITNSVVKMWGKKIIVDWADPEPDVNPIIMAAVKKLFIRNLIPSVDAEFLRKLLFKSVPPQAVLRIYVTGYFGFIHFDSRAHAEKAKDDLACTAIDGEYLDVQWARPRSCQKHNFCRSLLPRNPKIMPPNFTSRYISRYPGQLTSHSLVPVYSFAHLPAYFNSF